MKVIYAAFEKKVAAWEVIMYESGSKQQICKVRSQDSEKLREMARRGHALVNLETKQALEHGIDQRKGGMFLRLTPEQYARLKISK
jgi:hypothetical protein